MSEKINVRHKVWGNLRSKTVKYKNFRSNLLEFGQTMFDLKIKADPQAMSSLQLHNTPIQGLCAVSIQLDNADDSAN